MCGRGLRKNVTLEVVFPRWGGSCEHIRPSENGLCRRGVQKPTPSSSSLDHLNIVSLSLIYKTAVFSEPMLKVNSFLSCTFTIVLWIWSSSTQNFCMCKCSKTGLDWFGFCVYDMDWTGSGSGPTPIGFGWDQITSNNPFHTLLAIAHKNVIGVVTCINMAPALCFFVLSKCAMSSMRRIYKLWLPIAIKYSCAERQKWVISDGYDLFCICSVDLRDRADENTLCTEDCILLVLYS